MRLNDKKSARNSFSEANSGGTITSGLRDETRDTQIRHCGAGSGSVLGFIWEMAVKSMAKGKVLLATFLMCSLIGGCTPEKDGVLNTGDEAAIANTLLSITEEYNAVWETLDFEQISAFHADEFTYYRRGIVDSASASDFRRAFHDNVATRITAYWANTSSISVNVLGRDAGVVAFLFRGGVETPDGAKHDYNGALTYVFERRGEAWQIVHIHESAYVPDPP